MANKELKDFITAENDLSGDEYAYISQNDKTRKTSLEKIKEFTIGNGSLQTASKDVIGAINEIKTEIGTSTASEDSTELEAIKTSISEINNKIGDTTAIEVQVEGSKDLVSCINKINASLIKTVEYLPDLKVIKFTYNDLTNIQINAEDILKYIRIDDLYNVDTLGITNGKLLEYKDGIYKPSKYTLNDILNSINSYFSNDINAIVVDSKPTITSTDDNVYTITYTKDGTETTTNNTNQWFYYLNSSTNKYDQTIFIGGKEITLEVGSINLENYIKQDKVTSEFSEDEINKDKIANIEALCKLYSLIQDSIGNTNSLKTNDKTNLVSAINENTIRVNEEINSNILLNADFKNLTNTLGKTVYDSTDTNIFDNWTHRDNTITISTDGAIVDNSVNNGTTNVSPIIQIFKQPLAKNKEYSISISIDNVIYSNSFSLENDNYKKIASVNGSLLIYVIPTQIDIYPFKQKRINDNNTYEPVTVNWVKLEEGTLSTHFIHRDMELINGLSGKINKNELYTNNNLLINSDFKIWQRGEKFNNVNNAYTADRWFIKTTDENYLPDIRKESKGLEIIQDSKGKCTVNYKVEKEDFNRLKGKKVTLSYSINGNIVIKEPFIISESDNTVVSIEVNGSVSGNILNWVKLEFGEIATPYVPRLYGEELNLCKRYFQKIETIGWAYSTQTLSIKKTLAIEMTTHPTLVNITPLLVTDGSYTNKNKIYRMMDSNNVNFSVMSFFCDKYRINYILSNETNLQIGEWYTCALELDAEVY